jgi:membrane protein DedA with SNARE-associated domain
MLPVPGADPAWLLAATLVLVGGPFALAARREVSRRRLAVGGALAGCAVLGALAILRSGLVVVPREPTAAVRDLLGEYGYIALFAVFVIEGAMVLYFAPSESVVPAAVILLADTPAEVALVVAVSAAGATVGQTLLFGVARYGGRELIQRSRLLSLGGDHMDRFEAWFDRWGTLSVPASNTLPFVRGMLTVPAGVADMRVRRFVLLSALGTLCFETLLAAITLGALDVL